MATSFFLNDTSANAETSREAVCVTLCIHFFFAGIPFYELSAFPQQQRERAISELIDTYINLSLSVFYAEWLVFQLFTRTRTSFFFAIVVQ